MLVVSILSLIIAATVSYALYALIGTTNLQIVAAMFLCLLMQFWVGRWTISLARTTNSRWVNPDLLTLKARSFAFALPTALSLLTVGAIEGLGTLIGAVQIGLAVIVLACARW